MPPTAHSKLGASSTHRWMNCPGSVALLETVPRKESIHAARGTAAHYLAEKAMREGKPAAYWSGRLISVLPGGCSLLQPGVRNDAAFPVDSDMTRAVQVYLDVLRGDAQAMPGAVKGLETRFELFWLIHIEDQTKALFGTADSHLGKPFRVLHVYDYKNGRKYVEAEKNAQLLYLALGIIGPDNEYQYEEVEVVIVQPNAEFGPAVKRWRCTVEWLYDWAQNTLLPAVRRCLETEAPCIAGPWCESTFCDAQAVCPALRAKAVEISRGFFSPVPAERPKALPAPSELSQAQVLAVLEHGAMVESWIEEVRGYARQSLELGNDVTGGAYKLVRGGTKRRMKDVAETELAKLLRADAFEQKLVGVTEAEKRLADRLGWEKAKIKEFMATITESPEGKLTLVPASDNRQAVQPVGFKPVEDDPFNF